MSTLKATNIKNPSSVDNNLVLDAGGGVVISGVTTITTLNASEITGVSLVVVRRYAGCGTRILASAPAAPGRDALARMSP